MAIWVIKDGQREGPYEEQDIRELIYEGTYGDADAAIRDGQFDWSTLGQILNRQPPPAEPAYLAEEPALSPPDASPELPPAEDLPGPEALADFPPPAEPAPPLQVSVVDFQMPFGSMIVFMLKWMVASIAALFILGAIAAIFWGACIALITVILRH